MAWADKPIVTIMRKQVDLSYQAGGGGGGAAQNYSVGGVFGYSDNSEADIPIKTGTTYGPNVGMNPKDALQFHIPLSSLQPQPTVSTLGAEMQRLEQLSKSADVNDRQTFLSMQEKLHDGGFMGNSKFTPGLPDASTQKALHDALLEAAATGQTLDEVMKQSIEAGGIEALKSKKTIVAPDADAIRQVAANASQKILGRIDPELVDSIAQSYVALSQKRQDAANSADALGQGQTVLDVPDAQSYAEGQLRQMNPTEAGGNDYLNQFQNFMQILGTPNPATTNVPLVK